MRAKSISQSEQQVGRACCLIEKTTVIVQVSGLVLASVSSGCVVLLRTVAGSGPKSSLVFETLPAEVAKLVESAARLHEGSICCPVTYKPPLPRWFINAVLFKWRF
jgi:hypothetical protein